MERAPIRPSAFIALAVLVTLFAAGPGVAPASGQAAKPQHFYRACLSVIEGTRAEASGRRACRDGREALRLCNHEARSLSRASERKAARRVCDNVARQFIVGLSPPG
jgi:hypothetical protein